MIPNTDEQTSDQKAKPHINTHIQPNVKTILIHWYSSTPMLQYIHAGIREY